MGRQINWIKISLLNLLIVALIGVLMRYKIGFELLVFDQKHLQTAHSNFAFSGWISQTLMALMVYALHGKIHEERERLYNRILQGNLFFAYGMLISYALQGYGLYSIAFSICAIFISFVFAKCYFKDCRTIDLNGGELWFQAALFFNILSSLGGFALSAMMITKNLSQHLYLMATYWYLHFQYNGWFFFACMGLFFVFIKSKHATFNQKKSMFWLFCASCIPAYGLSILWTDLPVAIYVIVVLAAIAQLWGWGEIVLELRRSSFFELSKVDKLSKTLFTLGFLSLTIKLCLQLGSTVPAISKMAFGFRPIVIAYLHLVLLAFTTVFLIAYIYSKELITINKGTIIGIGIFVSGIYLNEIVLATQGIFSLSYTMVPYVNSILLGISVFIFIGLFILFMAQNKPSIVK
ncbi:MAG: hypothetical protein IPK03_07995 [Bacteroidetes bacterium]|nr:hypothetical protein [Bacteroidota bacterium]